MATKKKKARAKSRARKVKKMSTKKEAPVSAPAVGGIVVPEKRNTNFFSRIKKSNVQFAKERSKALGICHSEFVDLLIERERNAGAGTSAQA
jgi:hypothetical protein